MLHLIINFLGVACVVILVWSLFRASLPKKFGGGQADSVTMNDYLLKITRVTGSLLFNYSLCCRPNSL